MICFELVKQSEAIQEREVKENRTLFHSSISLPSYKTLAKQKCNISAKIRILVVITRHTKILKFWS